MLILCLQHKCFFFLRNLWILQPVNFIINETVAQVFSWELWKLFSLHFYLKRGSGTGAFLWILLSFSACNFIKNEVLAKVSPYQFWEISHPTTLLGTRPWYRCFSVNFTKFLRTFSLQNICEELLLMIWSPQEMFNFYFSLIVCEYWQNLHFGRKTGN